LKIIFFIFLFISSAFISSAQRVFIGVAGGLANYNGDLLDKFYPKKITNGFIGFSAHYELQDQIIIRGGFSFARVNGSDTYSLKANLKKRNLRFETGISEFSIVGEYYLFNLYEKKISPYIFAGLAIFHFNPYSYDSTGVSYYLKPLSTEGQGIYPDKKPYSLLQPAIPFGGGIKFAITDNFRLGFEFGIRKLFTDYLDDVSTSYPDYNDLLTAKGSKAIEFSYRGGELQGGSTVFPTKNTQRGSSNANDIYFFTGVNLTFRPTIKGGGGKLYRSSGKKSKYGCPTVPL